MPIAIKSLILFLFLITHAYAKTVEYDLSFDYKKVDFKDDQVRGMAVNGSIPAPTLYFNEGDLAVIKVTNDMDVDTSVHWHGILLPNHQDGVPYVNHPPIAPGEMHVFTFDIKQSGTYWYHAHTGLQEQRGIYGAIVIQAKQQRSVSFDKEETVVLSDWVNENPDEVLRTLKSGSDYYSIKKGSKQNLLSAIKKGGVSHLLKQGLKRMPGMDISDVAYDLFLANGKPETIIAAQAGDVVKLRLVNASTATYYTLQFAGGDMEVIATDGIDVKPVKIKDFLFAIAETYTLMIKVPESGLYELRASAQDGSGHSSIWIGEGERHFAPDRAKPNPYKMIMPESSQKMANQGMHHDHSMMKMADKTSRSPYKRLQSLTPTVLPRQNKIREIQLNLTGDMERYIWSINDEVLSADNTIKIRRGENVRFVLNNKTMMHHPMHLHGHFFRVINGQGEYSPLKHSVDVPPMGQQIIEFEANESQDWFFHCHILYHAKSGMARVISYEEDDIDEELMSIRDELYDERIFYYASGSFLSHMTEGSAVISSNYNSLHTEWEVGWQNVNPVEYEVNVTYERYVNRFLSGFAGVMLENDLQRGIFGFSYELPFNFESEWRVDTSGEFRVSLENSLQLTNHANLFADFQYDTESKEEWSAGLQYRLAKNIGIVAQYHSDFGVGGGFRLSY